MEKINPLRRRPQAIDADWVLNKQKLCRSPWAFLCGVMRLDEKLFFATKNIKRTIKWQQKNMVTNRWQNKLQVVPKKVSNRNQYEQKAPNQNDFKSERTDRWVLGLS